MKFVFVTVLFQACLGTKARMGLEGLELPKVPQVLRPGADGYPELPPIASIVEEFTHGKSTLNLHASTFAKHLAEVEKQDQLKLTQLKSDRNKQLKEQEAKNQVIVKEVAQLARDIIAMKKKNSQARADVEEIQKQIKLRRTQFQMLQKQFAEGQQFLTDTLETSDISKEVSVLNLGETVLAKPSDPKGLAFLQRPGDSQEPPDDEGDQAGLKEFNSLSFLELGGHIKHKHSNMSTKLLQGTAAQDEVPVLPFEADGEVLETPLAEIVNFEKIEEPAKLSAEKPENPKERQLDIANVESATANLAAVKATELDEQEEASEAETLSAEERREIDQLKEDLQKLRFRAKLSRNKLEEAFSNSYKMGDDRKVALLAQKDMLEQTLEKERAYASDLAEAQRKLKTTLTSLTNRLKTGGALLGSLEKAAADAPADAS